MACPAWLSTQAKREWKRLAPELVRLGVLTHLDRDSLAVYCEAVVHYRQAAELIDRSAVLVKSGGGRLVKNPALQVARDQAAIIRGFAREPGLTPSARSGISVPEAEDDLVSELLSGSQSG